MVNLVQNIWGHPNKIPSKIELICEERWQKIETFTKLPLCEKHKTPPKNSNSNTKSNHIRIWQTEKTPNIFEYAPIKFKYDKPREHPTRKNNKAEKYNNTHKNVIRQMFYFIIHYIIFFPLISSQTNNFTFYFLLSFFFLFIPGTFFFFLHNRTGVNDRHDQL